MTKNNFRVVYSVKNEYGYLIEKTQNFSTFNDAKIFVQILRSDGRLVGKPIYEVR